MAISDMVLACSNSSSTHEEREDQNLQTNSKFHGEREEEELNLPPGYRFYPTDCELIVHYLIKKILGCPIPVNNIKEIEDLYEYDPDQIPISESKYGKRNEAYFFTNKEQKHFSETRKIQSTERGYWKATGENDEISCSNKIIGFKKIMVFDWGEEAKGQKSVCTMHEYRVNPNIFHALDENIQRKIEGCVICKICYKKESKKRSRLQSAAESTLTEEENHISTAKGKKLTFTQKGIADSMAEE